MPTATRRCPRSPRTCRSRRSRECSTRRRAIWRTALRSLVHSLAAPGRDADGRPVVDKVLGMESRGFILGAPVALALGVGFVPVRKAGKLPRATYAVSYALEYGEATLEIHQDAVQPGDRVLLVDDVLATGGTARATMELVAQC